MFPAAALRLVNVNDFPDGTGFRSIVLSDAYQVTGNGVTLTSGMRVDIPSTISASVGITLGGGGGLTKSGAGTLALSGANTYSGVTSVTAGTLSASNNSALGAAGGGNETRVLGGATLDLATTGLTVAESIFFSGNGGGLGAVTASAGQALLIGPLVLTGPASMSGVTAGTGGLSFSGPVSDGGGGHQLTLYSGVSALAASVAAITGGVQLPAALFTGARLGLTGSVGPLTSTGGTIDPAEGASAYWRRAIWHSDPSARPEPRSASH